MLLNRLRVLFHARYRPALRGRGMERLAEFDRLAGYAIGGWILASWLDLGPRRTAFLAGLVLVAIALAGGRLSERSYDLRYAAASFDLFAIPAIAATTSDSVAVVSLVVAAIVVVQLGMFADRNALTLCLGALSLATALGILLQFRSIEPFVIQTQIDGWRALILALIVGMTAVMASTSLWWQATLQLTESKADLAAVLESTPVLVARVDAHGAVRYITGDTRSVIEPLLDSDGRLPAPLIEATRPGNEGTSDVSLGDHTLSATVVRQANGDSILTAYDISEMAAANRTLESMMRSKDELVASISHELRTPLTSVLGFSLELKEKIETGHEHEEVVSLLASESEEMASIIEDLLVAARADLGTLTVSREPLDLADIAHWSESALTSITPTIEASHAPVVADPTRLRQIVRNLLTNAARYGGDDIRVASGTSPNHAYIEVADRGDEIGIDRAEEMFEPYVSSGATSSQPGAIGLGLPVSRELATLMGGVLHYTHRGGWNAFRLELPLLNGNAGG